MCDCLVTLADAVLYLIGLSSHFDLSWQDRHMVVRLIHRPSSHVCEPVRKIPEH